MIGPFVYQDDDVTKLAYMAYSRNLPIILIVGAPSSGKTTFLDAVKSRLVEILKGLGDNSEQVVKLSAAEFAQTFAEGESPHSVGSPDDTTIRGTPGAMQVSGVGSISSQDQIFAKSRYVFVDDLDHLYEDSQTRESCERALTRWINEPSDTSKRFICGFGDFVEELGQRSGTDSPALKNAYEWLLFPTESARFSRLELLERTCAFLRENAERIHIVPERDTEHLASTIERYAESVISLTGGHPLLLAIACNRVWLSLVSLVVDQEASVDSGEDLFGVSTGRRLAHESSTSQVGLDEFLLQEELSLDSRRSFDNIIQWVSKVASAKCWQQTRHWDTAQRQTIQGRHDLIVLAMSGLFSVTRESRLLLAPDQVLCPVVQDHLDSYWLSNVNTETGALRATNGGDNTNLVKHDVSLEALAGSRIGLIRVGETQVQLSLAEWQIIQVLSLLPGQVLRVSDIVDSLSSSDQPVEFEQNPGAVRAAIRRLQEKLAKHGLGRLLVNIPRRGYLLDTDVVERHDSAREKSN